METINTLQGYEALFSDPDRMSRALVAALETRKFEIGLYWKRANYFWAFIALVFTGFFAVDFIESQQHNEFKLILSSIGLIFSLSWMLVNRGSKYWQENWEQHVSLLENSSLGPLFKTILSRENFSPFKLLTPYPFSVSKLNQILSVFISVIWSYLTLSSLGILLLERCKPQFLQNWDYTVNIVFILVIIIFFVLSLFIFGVAGNFNLDSKPKTFVNFENNEFFS